MFTLTQQRLIKELLLDIYRDHPFTLDFPVYFLPYEPVQPEDRKSLVTGLYELPELPWPDRNCIILSEDTLIHCLPDLDGFTSISAMIVDSERRIFKRERLSLPDESCVPLSVYTITVAPPKLPVKRNRLAKRVHLYLTKVTEEERQRMICLPLEDSAKRAYSVVSTSMQLVFGISLKRSYNAFIDYLKSVSAEDANSLWMCHEWTGKEYAERMGMTGDVLCYLCNIISPSHYVVKSYFNGGFGPSGSATREDIKGITASKPIFSLVSFDRLYQTYNELNPEDSREVKPHFRRGHIKHQWKKAGIDRFKLPRSTVECIRLAMKHNVERVYCPPVWVGNPEFGDKNIKHKVITEEFKLPQL